MSDEEKEYEVDDIVDEIDIDGVTHYRVRWKGYGPEKDTYEPYDNLENCLEILHRYVERKSKEEQKKVKSTKSKSKSSPYKPKVVVQKKENKKTKSPKSPSKKSTSTKSTWELGSYFSSDLDFSSDSSSDLTKSIEKKVSKNEKLSKDTSKKKKESSRTNKLKFKEDSDSGDIFSDLFSQQEETNLVEEVKKEKEKKILEKDKKKKEKEKEKEKEKSTKSSQSPKTNKSPSKNKKSTKKDDSKSKSDSKRHSSSDKVPNPENEYNLPFEIYIDDVDPKKNSKKKTEYNYYSRYSEEHRLVLNPFPIKEMKHSSENNGIQFIECEIPDQMDTDLIPVKLLKILQPNMLNDFNSKTKNGS